MNQQIAVRSDGSIAVATSIVDGWGYGYLIDANGERFEWPSPLASLLGQGSWKPIDGFDLSTITPPSEFPDAISKAYKRKYATRSEAARAAARARWGNRAVGYSQKVETQRGEDEFEGDVKTTDIEPFNADAFIAAAAKGPVSLVGVHGGRVTSPEQWSSDPRDMGGGWLGTGTYASLIDSAGVRGQEIGYGQRQARILLDITLKKPLVLVEGKNLSNAYQRDIGPAIEREAGIRLIENPLGAGAAYDLEVRQKLSEKGYDGIVMIRNSRDEGESLGSQVVVFDAKAQTKIIDNRLSYGEWGKVMSRGVGAPLVKAQDAIARFDGDGFDLVDLADLFDPSIAKAYKRKYGSRTEAARAAANARWGNKGYTQGAVTSERTPPVETKVGLDGVYPDEGTRKTILDSVITESVQPFNVDALIKAAEKGPVSLVGVHATYRTSTDLTFAGKPQGKGELGEGIYASLLTSSGIGDQQRNYERRGRQALVRVDLKKPLVLTDKDLMETSDIRTGGIKFPEKAFSNRVEQALFQDLRKSGIADDVVNDVFDKTIKELRNYGNTPVQYLKAKGYDGVVMATFNRSGAMVSAFNSSQVKAIDPVLTTQERSLVYDTGLRVTKAVGNAFDGRDFDLVDIEDLMAEPIAKMSRSEAGRFAANVRWGNRTKAVPSIDAASLSRGQKITIDGKQLGNLTVNMVDTGIDGDLRNVSIPGYALFDGANMGLRREQMPQVPSRAKPQFLSEMRLKGVRVAAQSVDPRTLKPSQTDVSAALTGKVLKMMRDGSFHDSPAGRILVSKDGFVIDGHHRWAAASAYAFDVPGARLPIIRVDLNAADLISAAREFGAREGIKTLGFGETLKKAARWLFGS
jgi:hypothetical protein